MSGLENSYDATTSLPSAGKGVTIRTILCPVDLSDFSPPILAHAMALAKWYGAEVTALHVFARWMPPASLATYPGWMMQVPEARESITKELQALTRPFSSVASALPLKTAEGDAATEIVRHADELHADLIVMGTHGRSGFDRFTLGSVTEKVLRRAACPVLTLPPEAARTTNAVQYQRILCPTDFSDSSDHALDFAIALALKSHATVTALHVIETIDGGEKLPTYIVELRRRQCDAEREFLHDLVSARGPHGGDIAEAVVLGKPQREILRIAAEQDVDLIVMGVRGRGPVDLTLFGSTTNQVVRRARCPVVTVRPRE